MRFPAVPFREIMAAVDKVMREPTAARKREAVDALPERVRPRVRYYLEDVLAKYRAGLAHCMAQSDPVEAVEAFPDEMKHDLRIAVRARLEGRVSDG